MDPNVINNVTNNTPPLELYHYFSFKNGLEFLKTRKFRFSSIFEFNDPFEFLIKTKYPSIFLSLNEDTTKEQVKEMVDEIRERKFFFNGQILEDCANAYIERLKHFRIGCFSELNNNILMWSHYAYKHTGLVVSFKTAMDYWGNDLHKVIYDPNRISVQEYDRSTLANYEWQRKLLIQKAPDWSYEKEWRFIKFINLDKNILDNDKKGYFMKVENKCVNKIIIGCKMSEENIKKIKDIINKWDNVPIMKAELENAEYGIKIKNI